MTNKEKAQMIQGVIDHPGRERTYYSLLEDMGDLKGNYADYMTTEPINCNEELQRVKNADYELCTALLTAILREDHLSIMAVSVAMISTAIFVSLFYKIL